MAFYHLHDHLSGFDSHYYNAILSTYSEEADQLFTEYIFPNEVKKKYQNLNLKFSAWLMVKNNHYMKFIDMKPCISTSRENFLCTFNKSRHPGRVNFVMSLISAGLFNPTYSSKWFVISHQQWLEFMAKFPSDLIDSTIDLKSICYLLDHEFHHGDQREIGMIAEDNNDLATNISQSFITAVCEPVPDSYVPFPTEKICYPIVNNSLWLTYAQPGYYKWIEEHMGLVKFKGINYDFDRIQDPIHRLYEFTRELLRLSKLPKEEKNYLYEKNEKNIQSNYDLVTSGNLIANLWHYDDECQRVLTHEIEHDIVSLNKQLMLAMRSLSQQKRITK